MFITVYGAGYVGLVTAVCLSKIGHRVICVDINQQRVMDLQKGVCPIFEDQLPELLKEQLDSGNLSFSSDLIFAINASSIHFIATGTPSLADGSADLSQVFEVCLKIAEESDNDVLIVTKSTVPVGTGDEIVKKINTVLKENDKKITIGVASNPEFLREGTAVFDFLHADRIVIGGEEIDLKVLKDVYKPLSEIGIPLISMSRSSSELCKYASNAMLACRVSFINQIAGIAELSSANIEEVRDGMALDKRIGPYFLNAGIGFGGSCFPKDNRALIHTSQKLNVDSSLFQAVEKVNDIQELWVIRQLLKHFNNDLKNKTIALWGLAFKPGTDDMREASSLIIIRELTALGVKICAFDPVANNESRKYLNDELEINYCERANDVFTHNPDALIIVTEWPEFKNYSLEKLVSQLGTAPLFDGRNCFALKDVRAVKLSYYYSVGRPMICTKIKEHA